MPAMPKATTAAAVVVGAAAAVGAAATAASRYQQSSPHRGREPAGMVRSTLNCLGRVRFGRSRWWNDVDHMPCEWRNATVNAFAAPLVGLRLSRLDVDGDGIVTAEEFREYFDRDGDGVITPDEFKKGFEHNDVVAGNGKGEPPPPRPPPRPPPPPQQQKDKTQTTKGGEPSSRDSSDARGGSSTIPLTARDAAAIAPPPGRTDPPTARQLDEIADIAKAARAAGTPYNIVRETWTVLPRATAAEVRAMRAAVLRINYFPTQASAPPHRCDGSRSGDDDNNNSSSSNSNNSNNSGGGVRGRLNCSDSCERKDARGGGAGGIGGDDDDSVASALLDTILNAHGRRSVLSVPVHGSWTDRTQTITTASGTASIPAEASVGDHFLQLVQVAPGVPLLEHVAMLVLDRVLHMYDADGAAGFTVATTRFHDEIGTHTAVLRWERVDAGVGVNTDTTDTAGIPSRGGAGAGATGDDSGRGAGAGAGTGAFGTAGVAGSAAAEGREIPGVTDPIRDTVRFLHGRDVNNGDEEEDDGTRYLVTLDVSAATAFQPHVSLNPIAVRLGCALAARGHHLSVDHFRAVAAAGCALRNDPRTRHHRQQQQQQQHHHHHHHHRDHEPQQQPTQ